MKLHTLVHNPASEQASERASECYLLRHLKSDHETPANLGQKRTAEAGFELCTLLMFCIYVLASTISADGYSSDPVKAGAMGGTIRLNASKVCYY